MEERSNRNQKFEKAGRSFDVKENEKGSEQIRDAT
jgi:hypothetical protein